MFCSYCGSKLPDNASVCPQCRKPAASRQSEVPAGQGPAGQRPCDPAPVRPAAGPTVLKGVNYNVRGLISTDRIAGDLILDDDILSFRQWKIRLLGTILTLGALPYTIGENARWRLSDIKSATIEKGRLLSTLRICGKDGRNGVFETSSRAACFSKMEVFHSELLSRIARARP